MLNLCNVPMQYKKGMFGISEFDQYANEMADKKINIDYSDYGEIVTCSVPIEEDGDVFLKELTLYGIPKDALEQTLQAEYNDDGCLKKIIAHIENKDKLLYIHYENADEAKEEIQKFALETADAMITEIGQCKDEVSRLFVEYFEDGEAMDYHAKIGTKAQKIALEKKYPQYKDIGDSCGDYPLDLIDGDNDGLAIRVKCADNESMDAFYYAVDIMTERIQERAPEQLNQAEDFRFISMQYD